MRRKALTRSESQARTREDLIEAGAALLLTNGYHQTSIAAIANEAGRTIGAVYSNFASKDELCLEVLKRRTSNELTGLLADFAASYDDIDSRLDVVRRRWKVFSTDVPYLMLAAEFAVPAIRDPEQRKPVVEFFDRAFGSLRVIIDEQLPAGAAEILGQKLDRSVRMIAATGMGLAAMQVLETVNVADAADTLVDTMRMCFNSISADLERLSTTETL